MTDVIATALGGANARGMENSTSSPKMTNVSVTASRAALKILGCTNTSTPPRVSGRLSSALADRPATGWGQFPDDTTSLVTIDDSEVKGATGTVKAEGGYKVNVGASKLDGEAISVGAGSEVKCAGVHDENYVFSADPTCP
jgi:glycerate-2-kinase